MREKVRDFAVSAFLGFAAWVTVVSVAAAIAFFAEVAR
jgi:hypothetical protein